MTRVLVTGAGGFIGAHVVEHFLHNTDWEIVATDSFRHKGKTDRLRPLARDWNRRGNQRLKVVTHDLTVPYSDQMIETIGPVRHIFQLASESHVDRSLTDPVPFVRNNVDVILNVLEYARKVEPEFFLLTSTDEVYGPIYGNDPGHPEWDAILPSNPYSASKAAQEAIGISYWRAFAVPVLIVNCMNLIGERQDAEKYLPMLISKISKGETVTVHGTPDEIGSRHYLHARNLADAMLFLANKGKPVAYAHGGADRPERYNVVGPDRVDNLSLARMVAGFIGKPLHYELQDFHTARPGHDAHYGLDGRLLESLGWRMPIEFKDSLRRTVEWTLKHPEWLK